MDELKVKAYDLIELMELKQMELQELQKKLQEINKQIQEMRK